MPKQHISYDSASCEGNDNLARSPYTSRGAPAPRTAGWGGSRQVSDRVPYLGTPSKNPWPVSLILAYIAYLLCRCCHSLSTPLVQDSSIAPEHRNRSKAADLVYLAASPVGRDTPGH